MLGVTQPPICFKKIEEEIPCKTNYTISLPITNWLAESQIFHVLTEKISGSPEKIFYKLLGNSDIEVSAHSTRNYLWKIYVLNTSVLQFMVSFYCMVIYQSLYIMNSIQGNLEKYDN